MRVATFLVFTLLFAACIEPPLPPEEPLPQPWHSTDVGNVGIPGSTTYNNNIFTLQASGFDIMREADEHHYTYQTWHGDIDITAHIQDIQNTRNWLKSGVVIRENLESGSRIAAMLSAYNRGMMLVTRKESNTNAPLTREEDRQVPWVRLIRIDNTFHGYISDDGNHWTHIESRTVDMPNEILVGLALASHDNTELATAHFTHITIQDPPDTLPHDTPQPDPPSQEYYAHGASTPPHPIPTGPRYYINPHGSDTNPGTQNEPWQTFDHATQQLNPGDTLILQDGTYTRHTTGMLHINNLHGTPTAPITIIAENERQAHIKSEGYTSPIHIHSSSHLTLIGITAIHGDRSSDNGARSPHDIIQVRSSEHINLKRMLAAYTNRYFNAHGIAVINSQNILVEESEVYHHHRHGIAIWQSRYTTVRRSYANSMRYEELPNGRHTILYEGGDEGMSFYGASESIFENSIVENWNLGFQIHPAHNAADLHGSFYGGRNNRVLGSIALDTAEAMRTDTRHEGRSRTLGNVFENFLVVTTRIVGIYGYSLRFQTSQGILVDGVTVYGGERRAIQGDSRCTAWGVHEGGKLNCDFHIKNGLFWNNNGAITVAGDYDNWIIEHSNFYATGNGWLEHTNVRDIMQVKPSGSTLGSGPGQTLVYIPEDSNMKGAGKDGADIGANILYRYQNGELTNKHLWHPTTGAFPHGAIVEGINDHEISLSTLHTRLGVSQETLPDYY